jgi:Tol biopolymer transport system component
MASDGSDLRQLTSGAGEQVGALSPDGRYVAFASYERQRELSLLSVESGTVTPFASDADAIVGFSPDGTKLLIASLVPQAQGLVQTVWNAHAVPGGGVVASFRLPPTAVGPVWSPDGKALSFRNRADPAWNVYRQGDGDAKPVALTHFTEGRVMDHAWSPDGSRLAVIRRTDDGSNVWISSPDGSRPVQVTQFTSTDVFELRWLPDNHRLALSAGKLSRDVVLIRNFR